MTPYERAILKLVDARLLNRPITLQGANYAGNAVRSFHGSATSDDLHHFELVYSIPKAGVGLVAKIPRVPLPPPLNFLFVAFEQRLISHEDARSMVELFKDDLL